jgi:hypothetical protein
MPWLMSDWEKEAATNVALPNLEHSYRRQVTQIDWAKYLIVFQFLKKTLLDEQRKHLIVHLHARRYGYLSQTRFSQLKES